MGHDNCSLPLSDLGEILLNRPLRLIINRAGRLIKNNDGAVFENCSRKA